MNIEPLPKKIYDKAVSLGVTQIELEFSGGNDEGYLNVIFRGKPVANEDFEREVQDWADHAYSYSGAGDGNDYGDDVLYDLLKKTATLSSWSMQRTEDLPEIGSLEIAE